MFRSNSLQKNFDCSPSEAIVQVINSISTTTNELDETIQRNILSGKASEDSIRRNRGILISFIGMQDLLLHALHRMPPHILDSLSLIIHDVKHLEQESAGLIYLHKGVTTEKNFTPNQLFKTYNVVLESKLI